MREKYYDLINQYNIFDTLAEIDELSYSAKIKLIQTLIDKQFSINAIKMALYEYKINYIDVQRINLITMTNIIEGLVKKYAQKL